MVTIQGVPFVNIFVVDTANYDKKAFVNFQNTIKASFVFLQSNKLGVTQMEYSCIHISNFTKIFRVRLNLRTHCILLDFGSLFWLYTEVVETQKCSIDILRISYLKSYQRNNYRTT